MTCFFSKINRLVKKNWDIPQKFDSQIDMLEDSLNDYHREEGNLNDTAVRFKLVIDETDDYSAVRILFDNYILTKNGTEIFELSDFPEDKTDFERSKMISNIKVILFFD